MTTLFKYIIEVNISEEEEIFNLWDKVGVRKMRVN